MTADFEIIAAESSKDVAAAKRLIHDYVDWLGVDLTHQKFDQEMASFPGQYAPPDGVLLLAKVEGEPAGVVGLRNWPEPGVCEMKRMWVADRFKRQGIGRALCERFIDEARRLGYARIWLDTLSRGTAGVALYRAMGFREIDAYRFNPEPDALYFEYIL